MNKFNHVESILEHIRDNPGYAPEEKETRYDLVEQSVQAFVTYHNEAVNQGMQVTMARIRLEGDFEAFSRYVSNLHERRKELHKAMIDHIAILNQLCEDECIDRIYDGPYDSERGRDDPDTRFGVAKFGEVLCHDMFRTNEMLHIPSKAHEAFKDYAKRVSSEGKSWSTLQRVMGKAQAQKDMDATGYGKP